MFRRFWLVWICVLGVGAAGLSANLGGQQPPLRLPGARMEINAADYPSLQDAIDALPAEGGLVRLPPGEFQIVRPLVVRASNFTLEGAGAASHIRNQNVGALPAIVLEHPQAAASDANRLWRVRLANFRLTGNPKSGHGVEARMVNELFLQGLTVSEHGEDGLRLDQCYEDPRVSDCLITYNRGTGLNLLGCHDIVVSANQFEENQDAIRCSDGFNLTCSGNAIDDHLGHGVVIENTYGSVVASNMIEECRGAAIVLDRDCYGIAASANVIAHNGCGIDLRDAHGCSISANTFTLMKTDALRIGPASGRIAAAGNAFCDSYIGEGMVKRAANDLEAGGIRIDGAKDVVVSGNSLSGVRPQAILVEGPVERLLYVGNLSVDSSGGPQSLPAPSMAVNNLIGD